MQDATVSCEPEPETKFILSSTSHIGWTFANMVGQAKMR